MPYIQQTGPRPMTGNQSIFRRHEKMCAFLGAFVLLMVLHQYKNVLVFPWDAGAYWDLAAPSSFNNFPQTIRGYFFPLLLSPAHFLSTDSNLGIYAFRVYSSLIYSYCLAILLPDFYHRLFGGKLSLPRRLLPLVLMSFFFSGVITYPLSDLPAFLMIIGSMHILLISSSRKKFRRAGLLLLGGVLAGAAYNTRSIYLFPVIFLTAMLPLYLYRHENRGVKVLALTCFLAGIALVSAPQSAINVKYRNSYSPAVGGSPQGKSIFALQLMWGITMQRYETTKDVRAPLASRYYIDPAGERAFVAWHLEGTEPTATRYMVLLKQHPMHFIGMYTRHFLNGLDLRDGEVYIPDASASRNSVAALNFSVMFLGALALCIRYRQIPPTASLSQPSFSKERSPALRHWWMWLVILLLPVLAILPGAIETRFFLALQLLIYCTLAFNFCTSEFLGFSRKYWLAIGASYFLSFAIFSALTTSTMATLHYAIPPGYRFGS